MGLDMYLYTNSRKLTKAMHEGNPYGDYITEHYLRSGVVLYWRKANAIHKWFEDHLYNVEDCGMYDVDWEQLMELKAVCERIVAECPLVDGKVRNGKRYEDGEWVGIIEDGKVLSNKELAEELLPTTSGFFFGSTDYDQWYYEDVRWTAEQLGKIESLVTVIENKYGWKNVRMKGEPDWDVRFLYHPSW